MVCGLRSAETGVAAALPTCGPFPQVSVTFLPKRFVMRTRHVSTFVLTQNLPLSPPVHSCVSSSRRLIVAFEAPSPFLCVEGPPHRTLQQVCRACGPPGAP